MTEEMVQLAAHLALTASIGAVKEIQKLARDTPSEAQRLLRAAWRTHAEDYRDAIRGTKTAKDGMQKLSELTALTVLAAYFEDAGDWDKMIVRIEKKLQETVP